MKKLLAFTLLLSATGFMSCKTDTKSADDAQKSNDILPRNNGHFLMYYYPTSSIFNSDNGKEFTKKDTCIGYPTYITSDDDGNLYSSVMSKKVSVTKSTDGGKTWTAIKAPTDRNESRGIGFCSDRIIYASYDQLFRTDDMGKTWIASSPEKMYAPNCESSYYGYRHFITDGDQFVIGVEVPSAETSRDAKNKYPGAVFYSHDGGKTFETHPFPFSVDPTPNTSDEYVYLAFVPKK